MISTRSLLAVCRQVNGILLYPASRSSASAVEHRQTYAVCSNAVDHPQAKTWMGSPMTNSQGTIIVSITLVPTARASCRYPSTIERKIQFALLSVGRSNNGRRVQMMKYDRMNGTDRRRGSRPA